MRTFSNTTESAEGLKDPAGNKVVDIQDLCISFGSHDVLKGVNLSVRKGENVVVLGKSGSGKSVLIKCLVGLLKPDSGSVHLLGKDVEAMDSRQLNAVRKKTGFLFQSAALYDSMSVRENLEFPLRDSKDIDEDEIDKRVEEALQNVGLLEAIDKMPSELSGGMRKRVGLARTIIMNPEIILYDEPTTGLDPVTSREISELIVEVQKKYNASGIVITHDMECAHITANRMMMLREGKNYTEGTFAELQRSSDPWIRSFFE